MTVLGYLKITTPEAPFPPDVKHQMNDIHHHHHQPVYAVPFEPQYHLLPRPPPSETVPTPEPPLAPPPPPPPLPTAEPVIEESIC